MNRAHVVEHPYRAVRRELRFAVPFIDFTRAFESLLGRVDPEILPELVRDSPDRARAKLSAMVGLSGFALFQKLEHGAIVRSLSGRSLAAVTYVFGNALIAYEMTKHEPAVGLYLPPRLSVCETKSGGVLVMYDLPSATLAQFDIEEVDAVARGLDAKVEKLVDVAAALAVKTRARRSHPSIRMDAGGRR